MHTLHTLDTMFVSRMSTGPNTLSHSKAMTLLQTLWDAGRCYDDSPLPADVPCSHDAVVALAAQPSGAGAVFAQAMPQGARVVVMLVRDTASAVSRQNAVLATTSRGDDGGSGSGSGSAPRLAPPPQPSSRRARSQAFKCIVATVDPRLRHAQHTVQVYTILPQLLGDDKCVFQGTVLLGHQTAARTLVLDDVAVSCGLTFVGNSTNAPFAQRMTVLDGLVALLQTLLVDAAWKVWRAPSVRCGAGDSIPELSEAPSRGVWLVRNSAHVGEARAAWTAFTPLRMAKFGDKWFVTGRPGCITAECGDVHIHIDNEAFGSLDEVPPSSVGVFQPLIEHDADLRHACRKWLVLHALHPASFRRRVDVQPWEFVQHNASAAADVDAAFAALPTHMPWETLVHFVERGVLRGPVPPIHTACVFTTAKIDGVDSPTPKSHASTLKTHAKKRQSKSSPANTKTRRKRRRE